MAIYRVLRDADGGKRGKFKPGDRTRLEWLTDEKIERLIARGVVSREDSPSLAELKGWQTRARRLKALGIITVESFLDADPDDVAEGVNVKPETAIRWKVELEKWFQAPPARRG